jgi:hypothetical protein
MTTGDVAETGGRVEVSPDLDLSFRDKAVDDR